MPEKRTFGFFIMVDAVPAKSLKATESISSNEITGSVFS